MRHDRRVALADARGFDDDDVEAGDLGGGDRVRQRLADFAAGLARRERAHVDLRSVVPWADRVHADAVAEQRAAALAARRVDRDHRDVELVALVEAQPAHQFVGQARLARAAGAGDSQYRHLRGVGLLVQRFDELRIGLVQFQRGDQLRQRAPALRRRPCPSVTSSDAGAALPRSTSHSATISPIIPCEAHLLTILRREDARDAVVVQVLDLGAARSRRRRRRRRGCSSRRARAAGRACT